MNDPIVSGSAPAQDLKRIARLFSTVAGTVAFDRNFGVDTSGIDGTPAAMEGALLVEYERKLLQYFPAYTIENIDFAVDCNIITPKVVIGNA